MGYTPESLIQLLQDERSWAEKVLTKIEDDLLDWSIPNTPYTVSWLLWHMGESHHWVHNAVVKMKKEDGEPIGYPEWKKGEKTAKEYIEIYLKESKAMEATISKMTP